MAGTADAPARRHRLFTMTFGPVYPLYLAKVERKGRTKDELDEVIRWLTGYGEAWSAPRKLSPLYF